MAVFSEGDRVLVTDQSSEHRGLFGVVMEVGDVDSRAGQMYGVRLDGFAAGGRVQIPEKKLRTSTQPVPLTY